MTCYSIKLRDGIFVKGYGFLSFAKNMSKNIVKNISKNVNGKYSQKPLDHAKQSVIGALETPSEKAIQKKKKKKKNNHNNKLGFLRMLSDQNREDSRFIIR